MASATTTSPQTTYPVKATDELQRLPLDTTVQDYYPNVLVGWDAAGYLVYMDDTQILTFAGIVSDSIPISVLSGGAAGDKVTFVQRPVQGFAIAIAATSYPAQTDVNRPVYCSDNQTGAYSGTTNGNLLGYVKEVLSLTQVLIVPAKLGSNDGQERRAFTLQAASGALNPHTPQTYVVTKAGVAALTLAAPTAGNDDGVIITLTSSTAQAHTLTATGLLNTGTASVNVATFAAQKGSGLELMAYNGLWQVLTSVGITFS